MAFLNIFFKTLGLLVGIATFFIIVNISLFFLSVEGQNFKFVEGKQESENIIAIIDINGPIINNFKNKFLSNITDFVEPENIKKILLNLEKIKPKILLIRINSPGGTVVASASLEKIFINFREKNNTKIYFYTNELLASGGYWVATSGDKIYANYGSIIGSIGVSGPSWYYYNNPTSISSSFFGPRIETKEGIQVFDQNIGNSKDLYNPFRKPTDEELTHLKKLISGIYDDFLSKVSSSRKIEITTLKNEIGALIYSSSQAKNNFLIDDILDYDELIKKIKKDNNFKDYKIVELLSRKNYIDKFLDNFFEKDNKIICDKLNISLISILPTYLNNC